MDGLTASISHSGARVKPGRYDRPGSVSPPNDAKHSGVVESQSFNRYSYVNNNPLRYTDPTGHWLDTALDIAGIAWDIGDIAKNGLNWTNGLSLAVDVVCLVVPIATGGGAVIRAASHADEVVDAARAVTTVDRVVDSARRVPVATEVLDKIADAGPAVREAIASFQKHIDVLGYVPEGAVDDCADMLLDASSHGSREADRVILGSFPEYRNIAFAEGKTYFNMPDELWDVLEPNPNATWTLNREFLDRAIASGKNFEVILGSGKEAGFFLRQEIDYLLKQGYKLIDGILMQ